MAQQHPSTVGSPHDSRSVAAEEKQSTQQSSRRGQDVKKARGMNEEIGKSPHEAGTDQRVEDAKKSGHNRNSH